MGLSEDREAQLSREIQLVVSQFFQPGYDITVVVREKEADAQTGVTLIGRPRAVTFLTSETDLRPLAHILKSAIQRRLVL